MHVLALAVELHLPECRSLKAKRSVLKPITEGARRRFNVAVAETDHQNTWQRAAVGIVAVGASPAHVQDVIDEVERFVWSFPNVHVLSTTRFWMEID